MVDETKVSDDKYLREYLAIKNLVTLKEYIDSNVSTLKEYLNVQIEALKHATLIAKESMEKRLDSMNEFRETLKDQTNSFIPRQEYKESIFSLQKQVDDLKQSRDILAGKASQSSVNIAYILTAISLLLSVLSFILNFIVK
jgi:hypothetical protein